MREVALDFERAALLNFHLFELHCVGSFDCLQLRVGAEVGSLLF